MHMFRHENIRPDMKVMPAFCPYNSLCQISTGSFNGKQFLSFVTRKSQFVAMAGDVIPDTFFPMNIITIFHILILFQWIVCCNHTPKQVWGWHPAPGGGYIGYIFSDEYQSSEICSCVLMPVILPAIAISVNP